MQHPLNRCIIIGLLVILLALPVGMINAQDTPGNCTVELETLILTMVQAQRAADAGNTFQAVQDLDAIQAELADLVTRCEGVLFPMPLSYTDPDESVTFNYPENWVFRAVDTNIYLVASSSALMQRLNDGDDLSTGDQAIILFVMPLDEPVTSPANLDEIALAFAEDQFSGSASIRNPQPLDFLDHPAQRLTYSDVTYAGYFDFIDYSDAEQPAILVVAGFALSSELELLSPLLKAFEQNLQYPPRRSLRLTGVGLDALTYTTGLTESQSGESIPPNAALAPDGSALAWYDRGERAICVYTLTTTSTVCAPVPEQWQTQQPLEIYWSPDAAYIAWTGDLFRTFREADIMLYEVATNRLIDATDDGNDDWRLLRPKDEDTGPIWLDAVITWGPDGYLYFLRDILTGPEYERDLMRSGLYRLDPSSGETEQLRDMTGYFADNWLIYPTYGYSNLEGAIALSPDASQIAYLVRHPDPDDPVSGVYTMTVSGTEEPVQVANFEQLTVGFPDSGNSARIMPLALAWTADGTGLVVLSTNPVYTSGVMLLHYVDLNSGQVTPLFDYSGLDERDMFIAAEGEDFPPAFYAPRTVVLAPDGENLLALHFWEGQIGLSVITLSRDPLQAKQTMLFTSAEGGYHLRDTTSTAGRDGTLLLQGVLFIPEN